MPTADLDTLPLRPPVRAALREARRALQSMYGDRLVKLVLFGSHARGEAHDESDVDLLVVLRGDVNFSAEVRQTSALVSTLLLEHEELLALMPLAEARFHDPHHPLLRNIRGEGVEL